jgi:hypothetical protein
MIKPQTKALWANNQHIAVTRGWFGFNAKVYVNGERVV